MANGTIAFDTLSTSGQISGTAVSVDTDYLAYGSARIWINMKGEDTFANNDSFNVSGVTDNGTGNHTVTIATNMANATYSALINASEDVDGTSNIGGIYLARTFAAGSYVNITMNNDGSLADRKLITNSVHGDLA